MIENELAAAKSAAEASGRPARRFKEFAWSTLTSWSRERRVVAKAEWTQGEANPRFVVTSLKPEEAGARRLYEKLYCARGDMENRIKECQLDLFADRTSAATLRANQLRLWFASFAYVLLCALRRIALKHTPFAKANCATIRLKLIKIGALVCVSVRRIKLAMASSFPHQREYKIAHARLAAAARRRTRQRTVLMTPGSAANSKRRRPRARDSPQTPLCRSSPRQIATALQRQPLAVHAVRNAG
jgi:hypothetical protein